MDRDQLLSFVRTQLELGTISRDDLLGIINEGGVSASEVSNNQTVSEKQQSSRKLVHIFYAIGAIVIIVGVGVLVASNWEVIGFAGRVLVTLGISLATYIAGFLMKEATQRVVSQVLFAVSAILAPLGAFVLLSEAGTHFTAAVQLVSAIVLTIIYGVALVLSKRNVLIIATAAFATWAYFAATVKVFGIDLLEEGLIKLAVILLGIAYICVGYGLSNIRMGDGVEIAKERVSVQGIFYGFGTLAALGGGIALDGSFNVLFIVMIFAAFYGSVYLKSRIMLIFGALFLVAHIIELTGLYFADSVGWPLALIVIGFLVMGVGYGTYQLNERYFSKKLQESAPKGV